MYTYTVRNCKRLWRRSSSGDSSCRAFSNSRKVTIDNQLDLKSQLIDKLLSLYKRILKAPFNLTQVE